MVYINTAICIFLHNDKMRAKSCSVLVLLSVAFASAQIPSLGWCPDYSPMADFDIDRFLGKWYEAEHYFTFSDVINRCVVTDYARASSGRIYVSNEVTNRITGVKRVIGGHLELSAKGNEGKMNVKYATTPISTESTLIVLETDYDNYAVIWSCYGIGPFHAQNVWVMTRERLAPGTVMQRTYGVLDKYKVNRAFVFKTDQEGCALLASDINASQGIMPISTVAQAVGEQQKSAQHPEPVEYHIPNKDNSNEKTIEPAPIEGYNLNKDVQ